MNYLMLWSSSPLDGRAIYAKMKLHANNNEIKYVIKRILIIFVFTTAILMFILDITILMC